MTRAILYGTFDLLHFGHLEAIEYCKRHCAELIVAVSTDEFNSIKGKKAKIPFWQRERLVCALKGVSMVIPEYSWEQKLTDIEKYNIEKIFVSEDFFEETDKVVGDACEVVVIPRTPGISSTMLRTK